MKTIKKIMVAGSASVALVLGCGVVSGAEYVAPKTSWGDPDLRGAWPVDHLLGLGLERNPQYGDRFYLTDEEYEQRVEQAAERNSSRSEEPIPGFATSERVLRQTSMISYPENGRMPKVTPYGLSLEADFRGSYNQGQTIFDSIEDFAPWDRCITRGLPVSMMGRGYNNGFRIFQSPGKVIIFQEMVHEARIIPVDDSPPLHQYVKQWMGEPRGYWDGDTLVVETTNFNGKVDKDRLPNAPRPTMPTTINQRVVERFTPTGPGEMQYEMTVHDPEVMDPGYFTITYPMYQDNGYLFFEYACHEGNTAVRNYIQTSRHERENAN